MHHEFGNEVEPDPREQPPPTKERRVNQSLLNRGRRKLVDNFRNQE
jgi:hypothetical protein